MSAAATSAATQPARLSGPALLWGAALALFLAFWKFGEDIAPWAFDYPSKWRVPAARWIGDFTRWLLNDATFGLFTFQ